MCINENYYTGNSRGTTSSRTEKESNRRTKSDRQYSAHRSYNRYGEIKTYEEVREEIVSPIFDSNALDSNLTKNPFIETQDSVEVAEIIRIRELEALEASVQEYKDLEIEEVEDYTCDYSKKPKNRFDNTFYVDYLIKWNDRYCNYLGREFEKEKMLQLRETLDEKERPLENGESFSSQFTNDQIKYLNSIGKG